MVALAWDHPIGHIQERGRRVVSLEHRKADAVIAGPPSSCVGGTLTVAVGRSPSGPSARRSGTRPRSVQPSTPAPTVTIDTRCSRSRRTPGPGWV